MRLTARIKYDKRVQFHIAKTYLRLIGIYAFENNDNIEEEVDVWADEVPILTIKKQTKEEIIEYINKKLKIKYGDDIKKIVLKTKLLEKLTILEELSFDKDLCKKTIQEMEEIVIDFEKLNEKIGEFSYEITSCIVWLKAKMNIISLKFDFVIPYYWVEIEEKKDLLGIHGLITYGLCMRYVHVKLGFGYSQLIDALEQVEDPKLRSLINVYITCHLKKAETWKDKYVSSIKRAYKLDKNYRTLSLFSTICEKSEDIQKNLNLSLSKIEENKKELNIEELRYWWALRLNVVNYHFYEKEDYIETINLLQDLVNCKDRIFNIEKFCDFDLNILDYLKFVFGDEYINYIDIIKNSFNMVSIYKILMNCYSKIGAKDLANIYTNLYFEEQKKRKRE